MSRKKQNAAFRAAAAVTLAITLAACGTAATATVAVVNEAPASAPAGTSDTVATSPTAAGPSDGWHYWPESTALQQEMLMMVATAVAEPPRTPPPDGYPWTPEASVATMVARPPAPSPTPDGFPPGQLPQGKNPLTAEMLLEQHAMEPDAFAREHDGKRVLLATEKVSNLLEWEPDPDADGISMNDLIRGSSMWQRGDHRTVYLWGGSYYVEMEKGQILCMLEQKPQTWRPWRKAHLTGKVIMSGVVRHGRAPLLLTDCRLHASGDTTPARQREKP